MPESQSNDRSKQCIWVLAASPVWSAPRLRDLPQPDAVIAADGGSTLAMRLGLVPDLVIGDLDSSDPALVKELEQQGIAFERFRHETKLETDTELAVLVALKWGAKQVLVLGAIGGRLDHSLANLLLLTHPRIAPHDVRIVDGRQAAMLLKPGRWNDLPAAEGDTVSLLPIGGEADGVRTKDLLYPLHGETLLMGRGRGVSNEASGHDPGVYYEEGLLMAIVVQHRPTMEENDGNNTE